MHGITVDSLTDWLTSEGIRVLEARLPSELWGLYDSEGQTIYLQAGMPERYQVATLLHEIFHYQRGDVGHQSPAVEDEINQSVALHMVDVETYRDAELRGKHSVGGLAAELELPRWVIEGYQRHLSNSWAASLRVGSAADWGC